MLMGENARVGRRGRVTRRSSEIQKTLPDGRDDRHLLRPHRSRRAHDPHRRAEPHRGRAAGHRRAAAAARQPAGRTDRRVGHPAVHAHRVHRHAAGRHLGQPDVPRRDRLRPDRRRLGRHDREHRPRTCTTTATTTRVSHLEKVRSACHEVARPVVFAVGIIIIVYLPILELARDRGEDVPADGADGRLRAGGLALAARSR